MVGQAYIAEHQIQELLIQVAVLVLTTRLLAAREALALSSFHTLTSITHLQLLVGLTVLLLLQVVVVV